MFQVQCGRTGRGHFDEATKLLAQRVPVLVAQHPRCPHVGGLLGVARAGPPSSAKRKPALTPGRLLSGSELPHQLEPVRLAPGGSFRVAS
jgi:hypothetical protein